MMRGYIGLGSNLGDREFRLQQACNNLSEVPCLSLTKVSSVVESPSWGYVSENNFLNAILEVGYSGEPSEFHSSIRKVEEIGERSEDAGLVGYADRTIDVDLLWLDGTSAHFDNLLVPHRKAHLRAFVLVPWMELAPEQFLHGKPLSYWIDLLPDSEKAGIKVREDIKLKIHE